MWRNLALVLGIAITQFLLYIFLFAVGFGIGDSGQPVPAWLGLSSTFLGTPLMFLLYLPPATFGHTRWWGDDMNFIYLLAVANFLVWGSGVAALIRYRQHRRRAKT